MRSRRILSPRLGGRLHGLVGAAPRLRSGAEARRSARAALPDLRHTFGSLAINYASIVPVRAWLGHADVDTTMRYLDDKSRADDARLLSDAFRADGDAADGGLAWQRERALGAVAVGLDRDLLLPKVYAQRLVAAPGVGRAYFLAASK